MRFITPAGVSLIKSFESFRSLDYLCPAGIHTIGYGHVIRPGERFDLPLTPEEAEELLMHDVVAAQRSVLHLISVPLSDAQYDALVSFAFNLGGGSLQRSTLRQKVNRQEDDEVPDEFMKWVRCKGRILPGLVRRRRAEAAFYAAQGVVLRRAA